MTVDWSGVDIFVVTGWTDIRKQISSLAVIIEEELKADPFGGSLFLFCNRSRTHVKTFAVIQDRRLGRALGMRFLIHHDLS